MASYNVSGHGLLSAAATKLSPEAFVAQVELAEDVLGLANTAFDGAMGQTARRAIVLQLNHQVALDAGAGLLQSESKGDQSQTYRQNASGEAPNVDRRAKQLADSLLGWATATGVR